MGMAGAPPPERSVAGDDEGRASGVPLAGYLVDSALGQSTVYVPDGLREDLRLGDVVHDAERFGAQYRYAKDNGLPLPLLRSVENQTYALPVNADSAFFPQGRPANAVEAAEALRRSAEEPLEGLDTRMLELADPEEVASSFRGRLGEFLTARFRGVEQMREADAEGPPWMAAAPPADTTTLTVTAQGILFQVFTQTQGLRVHFHPAYWHDANRVFGQPSSPVVGYLQPGRYVFGATGPHLALRFDPAEYDVPGTGRADLYW
jgi:hypothetical protein